MEGPGEHLHEVPPLAVRRFTVEEYHRLIALGVLEEESRVELVEGWIVPQEKRSPLNAVGVTLAAQAVDRVLPQGWHWRVRGSVTTQDSEPSPALAVVRGVPRLYRQRHPGPEDVAMAIDVSDVSLESDRLVKGRVYARAGIATYWIVNLVDERIEVYACPTGKREDPRYLKRTDYLADETMPFLIEGAQIALMTVADLMP